MTPQPTDKLDATTTVAVNGPADDPLPNERIVERHRTRYGLLEPDAGKLACPVLSCPGVERRRAYPT